MEIDKRTIKALSADTRVNIIKSLNERRKLPSELSRELKLAPSTVVEHLKKLEDAELIKKQKRGAKWVYYELTNKGESLVKPKIPTQFILVLSVGLAMVISGIFNLFNIGYMQAFAGEVAAIPGEAAAISRDVVTKAGEAAGQEIIENILTYQINWLALLIIMIGIILIIYGFVKLRSENTPGKIKI